MCVTVGGKLVYRKSIGHLPLVTTGHQRQPLCVCVWGLLNLQECTVFSVSSICHEFSAALDCVFSVGSLVKG